MTAAGSPGTASDAYRVPVKEGRHRAPPPPPTPPKFLPLHTPIAAAAVLLVAASVIAIYAPGAAWDVQAVEQGVTVPTASRATVPLTAGPLEVPTIGAEGAWDPEAAATPTTEIALSRPRSFAGVQGHAAVAVTTAAGSSEVTQAIPTTDRPPTTLPEVATTENTTTPSSPASESEAAATDSSAPTSTEEPTVTAEPTQTAEPTDVIGDVTDVIEEVGP